LKNKAKTGTVYKIYPMFTQFLPKIYPTHALVNALSRGYNVVK